VSEDRVTALDIAWRAVVLAVLLTLAGMALGALGFVEIALIVGVSVLLAGLWHRTSRRRSRPAR
jgi:hypothetical protein